MRELLQQALLVLGLAVFGLFAWMTRNPGAAWIEEAEAWPVVGPVMVEFRRAWVGPERTAEDRIVELVEPMEEGAPEPIRLDGGGGSAASSGSGRRGAREGAGDIGSGARASGRSGDPASAPPDVEIEERVIESALADGSAPLDLREVRGLNEAGADVGSFAGFGGPSVRRGGPHVPAKLALEHRWLLPGQPLFEQPAAGGPPALHLVAMAHLPVHARQGSWARVVFRGRELWADTGWEPDHHRRRARRGGLRHRYEPVRASDSRRLKDIREHLGVDRPERSLGAYSLYTDVDDEELLSFLDAAAAAAEDAYFARYARLPAGDPDRAVVLFAREADYRVYSEDSNLPGFAHAGHAGPGILAFFAEGKARETLAGTLVHEIAHLLNRRALTAFLPPWLSEGIATELGSVHFEVDDRSLLHTPFEHRILRLTATLRSGDLPGSSRLMALDRESFYRPEIVSWSYSHSGALVRYLMSERHRDGFRQFLKRIADGHGADAELLLDELGVDPGALDAGFGEWLEATTGAITG